MTQKNFFKIIITLLSILSLACGGSDKQDKEIPDFKNSDFEKSIPLGEMQVEVTKVVPIEIIPKVTNKKPEEEIDENQNQEADFDKILNQEKSLKIENNENTTNISVKKNESQTQNKLDELVGNLVSVFSTKSKIIALDFDLNKNLIVAERYQITSIKDESSTIILNDEIFKKSFNKPILAISTIKQTKEHGLWVGFTNGEIITLKNSLWTKREGGPSSKKFSIKKIFETSKGIFIGSKGLYQWDAKDDRFMSSDTLKNEIITDINQIEDNKIIFSTPANISTLSLDDKTTSIVYNSFTGDYPITKINIVNNKILLSGRQGILSLSKSGFPLERFGTSNAIKEVCTNKDAQGIVIDNNNKVIGIDDGNFIGSPILESKNAHSCLITENEELFIGLDNQVFYGLLNDFINFLKNNTTPQITDFNKIYANSCQAAEELIKSQTYSKQISTIDIDGRKHVFFNGIQTCPNNHGFMRNDGYTVIENDKNGIDVFEFNSRKSFKLPDKITSDIITALFIDSKNDIYLGTKNGLFIKNNETWITQDNKELKNDLISDIMEDTRGNIWISTRIQNETKQNENSLEKNDKYKALHLRTKNDEWAHFGASNGLDTLGISAIHEHNKDLYLATPYGFSILGNDSKIKLIGRSQGLINYIVENINFDTKNRIWLSHGFFQNGISWLDQKNYHNSTQELGLFSNRISTIAEDDKNRIWIMDTGGKVGIYSYDVLNKISNTTPYRPERAGIIEFTP